MNFHLRISLRRSKHVFFGPNVFLNLHVWRCTLPKYVFRNLILEQTQFQNTISFCGHERPTIFNSDSPDLPKFCHSKDKRIEFKDSKVICLKYTHPVHPGQSDHSTPPHARTEVQLSFGDFVYDCRWDSAGLSIANRKSGWKLQFRMLQKDQTQPYFSQTYQYK